MSAVLASDSEFTRERLGGGRGWGREGEAGGGREGGEVFGGKRERDNPEMRPYSDGNLSSLDGQGADSNTGRPTRWDKDNDHLKKKKKQ